MELSSGNKSKDADYLNLRNKILINCRQTIVRRHDSGICWTIRGKPGHEYKETIESGLKTVVKGGICGGLLHAQHHSGK